jgi:hypothetical protein
MDETARLEPIYDRPATAGFISANTTCRRRPIDGKPNYARVKVSRGLDN